MKSSKNISRRFSRSSLADRLLKFETAKSRRQILTGWASGIAVIVAAVVFGAALFYQPARANTDAECARLIAERAPLPALCAYSHEQTFTYQRGLSPADQAKVDAAIKAFVSGTGTAAAAEGVIKAAGKGRDDIDVVLVYSCTDNAGKVTRKQIKLESDAEKAHFTFSAQTGKTGSAEENTRMQNVVIEKHRPKDNCCTATATTPATGTTGGSSSTPSGVKAKPGADSSSLTGTVTVEIPTAGGKVRVILPDDIRPGDTISGTVTAEPGAAPAANTVEGEVIEVKTVDGEVVATKKLDPSLPQQPWTFTVPQGASSLQFSMGKHIPEAALSINPAASPAQLGNFELPRLGQTGRPITIPGNFDGHSANTGIGIGGREIPVIAESPRKAVVQIPADCPTGPSDLTVKEGDLHTKPFNVVSLKLSADKLNLRKGEKTNLNISITGLEGLKDNSGNIRLQIENASPQTVSLTNPMYQSNSNAGTMPATRAINTDGGNSLVLTEQLTGINPGNFQINATLFCAPPAGEEPASVRDQVRKIADLKKEAANLVSGNSKAKKELEENAKHVTATADNEKNWDKDGNPKNKEGFKKFLKDEKEKLDHIQKVVGADSAAGQKIGDAKDAIDKAAKDAGISLDE